MSDEAWQCPVCSFTATYIRIGGQAQPYSGENVHLLRTQRHLLEHLVKMLDRETR